MLAKIFSLSHGKLVPTGLFMATSSPVKSILSVDPYFQFDDTDFNDGPAITNFGGGK